MEHNLFIDSRSQGGWYTKNTPPLTPPLFPLNTAITYEAVYSRQRRTLL